MLNNNLETAKINKSKGYYEYKNYESENSEKPQNSKKISGLGLIKNYKDYSDLELVNLYVSDRDELAFNVIFERYNDKVKRLALKILKNVHEADDIVQDVFIIVLNSMDSFRNESKFSSWLYSISLNCIRNGLRKKRRETKFITQVDDKYINDIEDIYYGEYGENNYSQADTPELININNEFLDELHSAVELLPEKYKEPLNLRINNGFSNNQIANQLRLSLPAVKSRIHRARKHIKKGLGKNI